MNPDVPHQRVIPPSRRRDKPILSCTLCRRRKLKCDRQQPCKTCVDRGLSLSCTYVRNAVGVQEPKAPDSVHDRINQLEKLVTTLMNGKEAESHSPAPSIVSGTDHHHEETNEIPGTPDRVRLSEDTTSYTNSSHWTSILDGISELREHLDEIPTTTNARGDGMSDIPGPDLFFGQNRQATKQELLAALPPRADADSLVNTFFVSMDTSPSLVHRPTFLREYADFWKNPFETPTMWLGLLYGILALGSRFQATSEGYGPALQDPAISLYSARMDYYRQRLVQCLCTANYTKCPPYTVETMLLYFGTEYLRSADTQFSLFLYVGIIVRVGFRMGYHRDPGRFPNISPYKGEMRRRAWMMIMSLDLISSTAVGLPRMIQPSMYDTQEPRNLAEEDLVEDMVELPPSRPETELTQLLFAITLTRVRASQAKILDLMNRTAQPPYKEIMDFDENLREVYEKIPDQTKGIPVEQFDLDVSPVTMRRMYLGISFLKAQLTLHRPYSILGRTDPRYAYSRSVCLNAAIDMLRFQRLLDNEIQPGGKLWSPGWQIFTVSWYLSSIVAQDFLLATTVLVVDLDEDIFSPLQSPMATGTSISSERPAPNRQMMIAALQEAHQIWSKASVRSMEARKVVAAIRLVLGKVNQNSPTMADRHDDIQTMPDHFDPHPSMGYNNLGPGPDQSNMFTFNNDSMVNPFDMSNIPMDFEMFGNSLNWNILPQNQPGRF